MQHKMCTKCLENKPVTEFVPQKRGKYGVTANCRPCVNEYQRLRKNTDTYRIKHAADMQKWRVENPERYAAYVEANREKIRETSKQSGRRWRQAEPERHLYYHAKARAKREELPFDIELSDVVIPTHCPILGIKLVTGEKNKPFAPDGASLDKIIPSKGYVKGNVCVISGRANRLKNNGTPEELEAIYLYVKKAITSQSDTSSA